ncbi:mechanosensitive ion channel family protein [Halobacteriales archaeon QS_4_70_19]|nr:MAG: mechanosensitive ion channel family protein [Halobacteriales archaeon QS_4_70_19]
MEQYLMSAALLAFFVAATTVIYVAGSPLKRRVDDKEIVEAMQSLSVTVVGLAVSIGLVVVWRLRNELLHAFTFIKIGPADGVRALVVAATLAAAFTVTRITKRAIRRGSEADTITAHQKEVAHHVVQLLVFAPAVLFVLALYGVNPGNLLLGAGAAGLLVGLAARHTLGAIVAGFVLLISRPFEVNDWVVIDDEEGVVTDISIFNTEIRTFDNEIVIIPNDEVTKNNTINRSRNGKLRIQVDVGVDYDVEVARAMELAREAMHVLDEVLDEPAPDVVVDKFGSSSVVLTLRFWIPDPSVKRKWAAQNAVIDAVKEAFEEAGVKIPYPQRELMGREETDGFRLAGDLSGRGNGKDDSDPRSAITPASSVDGDGPGTYMSAVTDPTVAIDTDPDGAPDPRSTEGEYVSAVERVEDRELFTPVEPMDREDD